LIIFTGDTMNSVRLILAAFLFCQTASIVAMEKKEQQYYPRDLQLTMYGMSITYQPLPKWIPWLIKRNEMLPIRQSEIWRLGRIDVLPDNSRMFFSYLTSINLPYPPGALMHQLAVDEIDCTGSFANHKATHPHVCTEEINRSITVTLAHDITANSAKVFTITNPCDEKFLDTAISRDSTRFVAITQHYIMIWSVNDGHLIDKIKLNDCELVNIVDIKANSNSIVLQDSNNTIFLFDCINENKHEIYSDEKKYHLIPIAFENKYCFIAITESRDKRPLHAIITYLDDSAELFPSLHFDQIRLLSWIYKAAATGHKLNLKGDSPGIIHARKAFNSLPERIKQLVKEFVVLLGWTDSCINWLRATYLNKIS